VCCVLTARDLIPQHYTAVLRGTCTHSHIHIPMEQQGDKQDSQTTGRSANTPFAHFVMHNHHQNILFILYLCCKQRKHWFYLSSFTTQHQQHMQQQDIYFCFLGHITWI